MTAAAAFLAATGALGLVVALAAHGLASLPPAMPEDGEVRDNAAALGGVAVACVVIAAVMVHG